MRTKINISVFLSFIGVIAFSQDDFIPYEQAKQHTIVRNSPAPDFFEGALIGNGGMGVVVCTRPDTGVRVVSEGAERILEGHVIRMSVKKGQHIFISKNQF